MQIFIFSSGGACQSWDGGTAVVVAENFQQAKDLLVERKVNMYYLELTEILEIEELAKNPRVLGAFVHSE